MRFAALTQLSPEAACNRLIAVDTERKLQLSEWLALIALIDERRDYRAAGYSSMSAFCMKRLHMTLDRSLRLIQVARVARRHPMTFDFLADLAAPASTDTSSAEYAPAHTGMTRRGRITPSASGEYDVRLSITEDERAVLRRAEDLLGHAVHAGDPAEIYARAMKAYVAQLEKERCGVKRSASVAEAVTKSRKPTREMRGFVEERDGGQCSFTSPDGHRCEETRGLECDHIVPWSQGGLTTPSNLRLLCPAHNRFVAEQLLGKEYVQGRREIAERERARGRQAAVAAASRQQVRSEERQSSFDDIVSGLCNLGYSETKARVAAAQADSLPHAPVEECMKFVLKAIGRDCRHRGERMARCTT